MVRDGHLYATSPENVVPAALYLVSDDAPTRTILCAGAGHFAISNVTLTPGAFAPCSDAASHITGTELWIDGGSSLLVG